MADSTAEHRLKFEEVLKSSTETSVWNYFLREVKRHHVKCKDSICNAILKYSSATSGMHTHLRTKHNITLKEKPQDEPSTSSVIVKKTGILDPFLVKKRKSLLETLARMTALDGFSFSVFCTSNDLRMVLEAVGFDEKLPKSPNTIRNMVIQYSRAIREQHLQEITKLQKTGERFSVVFDEWTSNKNRRYINIILKSQTAKFWNIGLVRIKGSFTSEKCLEQVEQKLLAYNLDLKRDVISIVTDGTTMMTKVGRLSPTWQQLCLAHGVQLAVTDVLYSKIVPQQDIDMVDVNSDESDDEECGGDDQLLVEREIVTVDVTRLYTAPIISSVRKIVKLFKKSALKNEILQKYVQEDFHKELNLILDCKRRWSSLYAMLQRFLALKNCILKSVIDVNSETMFGEDEFKHVSEVVAALEPLKLTVEALCRRDATLLTADAALCLALQQLSDQTSEIAFDLSVALRRRIKERITEVSSLVQYLHSGKCEVSNELFNNVSKSKLSTLVMDLVSRLHPETNSRQQVTELFTSTFHHDSVD